MKSGWSQKLSFGPSWIGSHFSTDSHDSRLLCLREWREWRLNQIIFNCIQWHSGNPIAPKEVRAFVTKWLSVFEWQKVHVQLLTCPSLSQRQRHVQQSGCTSRTHIHTVHKLKHHLCQLNTRDELKQTTLR